MDVRKERFKINPEEFIILNEVEKRSEDMRTLLEKPYWENKVQTSWRKFHASWRAKEIDDITELLKQVETKIRRLKAPHDIEILAEPDYEQEIIKLE